MRPHIPPSSPAVLAFASASLAGCVTQGQVPGPPDGVDPAPQAEECNGEDDDGDGLVDEGSDDFDSDGVADCVDDACEVVSQGAGGEAVDEACAELTWEPPTDLADFVVEWSTAGGQAYSPPIVARTTDHDGDGDLDPDDLPDIYTVDLYSNALWRFSGDGASADLLMDDVLINSLAVADVDGDGTPNLLLALAGSAEVCALEPDLRRLWCSADITVSGAGGPVVGDTDDDEGVEVVSLGGVVDGATGALEVILCDGVPWTSQPVLGDVDGDGRDEILCGRALYRGDGTVLFDQSDGEEHTASTFTDRDLDGVPEVLSVDLQRGPTLYDLAGTVLAARSTDDGFYSAPCVADVDGDGDAEIGVARGREFELLDGNLDLLWSTPVTDTSGNASCSAFDFDGDGAFELVYADEIALHVFSGDGTVLFTWEGHSSGTALEYPTIADVDLDGAAEIVVAEAYAASGIVVLGHASDGWAPADPLWADNAATGGRVLVDGALNPAAPSPFRGGGRYHVQEAGTWDVAAGTWTVQVARPDLGVSIDDVCAADCVDGPFSVGVSVRNRGPVDAVAVVVLSREDRTGAVEVGRATVAVAAGTRGEPLVFAVEAEGELGWVATVEDASGAADCAAADNEVRLEDRLCP